MTKKLKKTPKHTVKTKTKPQAKAKVRKAKTKGTPKRATRPTTRRRPTPVRHHPLYVPAAVRASAAKGAKPATTAKTKTKGQPKPKGRVPGHAPRASMRNLSHLLGLAAAESSQRALAQAIGLGSHNSLNKLIHGGTIDLMTWRKIAQWLLGPIPAGAY